MEPKQWTYCPYCGHEMVIDGDCENCEAIRLLQEEWHEWGWRLEQEKIVRERQTPDDLDDDERKRD